MTVLPPPQPTITVSINNLLRVFGDVTRPPPPLRMAAGFNDLEQCLAWAWLTRIEADARQQQRNRAG